jgi:hypothetical protein
MYANFKVCLNLIDKFEIENLTNFLEQNVSYCNFNDFSQLILSEIGGSTRECPDQSMEATQKLMKFLFIEFSQ